MAQGTIVLGQLLALVSTELFDKLATQYKVNKGVRKMTASARFEAPVVEKGSVRKWLLGSHNSRPLFLIIGVVLFTLLVAIPLPQRLLTLVSIPKIAAAYAKDAVIFIFGVLALSKAITKTGLDRRTGQKLHPAAARIPADALHHLRLRVRTRPGRLHHAPLRDGLRQHDANPEHQERPHPDGDVRPRALLRRQLRRTRLTPPPARARSAF